jgi:CRP-like cAMP-binding protein
MSTSTVTIDTYQDVLMKKQDFIGQPGDNFGELALKGNKSGQQRRMSVLAAQDCHFAVLSRTNYDVAFDIIKLVTAELSRKKEMKMKLIKSLYFLQGINEKVIDSLQMYSVEKRYRFGDKIFDWDAKLENFYIVQEGEVKLLRKAVHLPGSDGAIEEGLSGVNDDKRALENLPVVAKSLFKTNKYVEIGIRTEKQPFGEEYFYLKEPTEYKVVVSSERVLTLEIPFKLLESTLHTFAFFNSMIRDTVMTHYNQNIEWRADVEERFQKIKGSLPSISAAASALFKVKMDKIMGREIPPSSRAANVLIK